MQSWDGDALRCIRAQVWDALVLGFMELQGGDASQHSAEKWAKPIFFLHLSPFKSIFNLLFFPKKHWVLQNISYFRRKGQEGMLFSDTPWAY